MKNLCIIPARGGSKRIPRKNVKEFLGKPIIAYSIEAALKSGLFDSIYVTILDSERSVSMSDLKIAFEDSKDELGIIGLPIKYYSNVRDCITDVITMRKSGDCVFAAGSLYLVGQIKSAI